LTEENKKIPYLVALQIRYHGTFNSS